MLCPQTKISLWYSEQEWSILEKVSLEDGGRDLRTTLYLQAAKLGRLADMEGGVVLFESEDRSKKKRGYSIPEGTSCQIMQIARLLQIPPATVIARFITNQMLHQHYEANGLGLIP